MMNYRLSRIRKNFQSISLDREKGKEPKGELLLKTVDPFYKVFRILNWHCDVIIVHARTISARAPKTHVFSFARASNICCENHTIHAEKSVSEKSQNISCVFFEG